MTGTLSRITYVEDEPDIREVAQIALETLGGFTLDICSNGAEALEKAPAFRPDLILLDVMMPDMDGIETFKRLKSLPQLRDTPVIFMTAKAQVHEVASYETLGATGIITKPFDPISLSDEIQSIWENRR